MAEDLIPNQVIMLIAILGSLLCIYCTDISIIGGIFSVIAALLSSVLASNTLRKIGKYSLGTGVPSIVYMLTAISLLSFVLSLVLSIHFGMELIFPVASIIVSAIISAIVSLICRYVFKIQVDILFKSFISISVASVLLIMSLSTLIAQTYNPFIIYEHTIQNGLVILLMIITVMIVQNPYNSCMGPNEDQYRTLSLTLANTFLMLIIVSVISISTTKYWIIYVVLSLIGWFISIRQYILYTKHQAASIRRYGLWPKDDGEN
ncbi:MAG: tetrahydromethanopterin S-methyltransferase subunit C [Methanosphaera sp. rholeuAM270]|nr:MAG: tetrahydromethanopterin S-methyltransferase subunit C [Methanosphaera sp. rholeuAM270]